MRLIDADALYREVKTECNPYGKPTIGFDDGKKVLELIDAAPTIEPEVRHGRWIPIEYDSYADGVPVWDKWECSECGHEHSGEEDTLTAFCPACGARMNATDTSVGGKGGDDK